MPQNGGRRLNLHAWVVWEFGLRILAGGLRPGDVLPNETDLGPELGVSRSILREAIKSLAVKGLVASRTRVGPHVRDPSIGIYLTWTSSVGGTPLCPE